MELALALSLSLAESSAPASASTSALGASECDVEEDPGLVRHVSMAHTYVYDCSSLNLLV